MLYWLATPTTTERDRVSWATPRLEQVVSGGLYPVVFRQSTEGQYPMDSTQQESIQKESDWSMAGQWTPMATTGWQLTTYEVEMKNELS